MFLRKELSGLVSSKAGKQANYVKPNKSAHYIMSLQPIYTMMHFGKTVLINAVLYCAKSHKQLLCDNDISIYYFLVLI